ncbi:uncharacterized protein LOC131404206 [Diceros bicornis minor]|uniref:uncharacterized protein LOC131404206 n=1 Tax=Diceros bicornis minor TaxID=77932 RepID=UPI0026F1EB7D|nr:uncharacterized protein LOC131404206 [Diceros bicornis minor]
MIPPSTSTRCPAMGGALGPGPQRPSCRPSGRKRRRWAPRRSSATAVLAERRKKPRLPDNRIQQSEPRPSAPRTGVCTAQQPVRVRVAPCLKRQRRENSRKPEAPSEMRWRQGGAPEHALFTIAKKWKEPKCPSTDEWIKKMWYIYTMEYYSAIKEDKIAPLATIWMDLEGIMLSEISQREKDKHHMISLTGGRLTNTWTERTVW